MRQLALFTGSLCVLWGSVTPWVGAFYLCASEMIQILQNRIIAAGIPIPCQGFFESKSKKGLHRRNRFFCLLLYAPLTAFRTRKKRNPGNLTCSCGPESVCFQEMLWKYVWQRVCVAIMDADMSNYKIKLCTAWNGLRATIENITMCNKSLHKQQTVCTFLLQVSTQGEMNAL